MAQNSTRSLYTSAALAIGACWLMAMGIFGKHAAEGIMLSWDELALAVLPLLACPLWLFWRLHIQILQPLNRVRESIEDSVRDGQPISVSTQGALEFVSVAQSFNQLIAQLQAQRQDFETALEAVSDGVWVWDLASNELWASPQAKRLYGIRPDQPITREQMDACLLPEDLALAQQQAMEFITGLQDHFELRQRFYRQDGTIGHLSVRGVLIRDAEGKPVRMIGANTDVSHRVEAEQARARYERLLRESSHMARLGSWEWLLDGEPDVIYWSPELIALYDFPSSFDPDTHRAESVSIYGEQDRLRIMQALNAAKDGEAFDIEVRVTTHQGKALWVRTIGMPERENGRVTRVLGCVQDISDLRATEDSLRSSQAENRKLALVAAHTHNAVIVTDADKHIEWVNEAFARITGYNLDEVRGRKPGEFLQGPETEQATVQMMRGQLARGEGFKGVEVLNYGRDGRSYWLEIEVQPLRDEAGQLQGFMAVEADITTRKLAEQALAQQREQFQLALQASSDGIWDWNLSSNEIWFSARWKEQLGYQEHELQNSLEAWERVILPEDHARAMRLVDDYLHGRVERFEDNQRFRHRDGHIVWIHTRAIKVCDRQGRPIRLVGAHTDITQQVLARDALNRSRTLLSQSSRLAGLGGWSVELQGGETYWSEEIYRLFELDPAMPPDTERLLALATGDGQQLLRQAVRDASVSGEGWDIELPVLTAAGHARWMRMLGQVEREEGKPRRLCCAVQDITERKQAEQALIDARRQAEASVEAKSAFLANVSHEIRTPLNAIVGFSELLLRDQLSTRQRDSLNRVHNASEHLLGLINDLLDLSKMEAGKLALEQRPFSLRGEVRKLLSILGARAREKGLILRAEVEADLPDALEGDPLRLMQILTNLLSNAIKFTDHGTVCLLLRGEPSSDGQLWLKGEVADTGIGIDPEVAARLFTPFTQADESTTRRYGGTGLGLSICRQLVELMGGRIEWSPSEQGGSLFCFRVQLGYHARRPKAFALPSTLLLIGAQDSHCRYLQRTLQHAGAHVISFAALEQALPHLAHGVEFSAILLLDESLEQLQAAWPAGVAPVPILLLGQSEARQVQAGVYSLAQPFLDEELIQIVEAAIRHQDWSQEEEYGVSDERPRVGLGLKVLVAEDNESNQVLVRTLLEEAGCEVHLVADGAAAVEALRQQAFDLVLMDMQMPVMDGLEATRRIRSELGCGNLPIVALTANVMSSDRERCQAAGMNHFLSKPIAVEALTELLGRYTQRKNLRGESPVTTPRPALPSVGAQLLPDALPGLEVAEALKRLGGREALYRQLLQAFTEHYNTIADDIEQGLTSGDHSTAHRLAHSMKSVAANIGAEPLREASAQLESIIKDGADTRDAIEHFRQCFQSTLVIAKRLLQAAA